MKPRIYWQYYPKSRRGYWRVTPVPKTFGGYRCGQMSIMKLYNEANRLAGRMNSAIDKAIHLRQQYAEQLELRKTT